MEFEPLAVPAEASDGPAPIQEGAMEFEPLPEVLATPSDQNPSAFDQGYQAGVELASSQVEALASALKAAEEARSEQMRAQASRLEAEAASLACQIASSLVDAELTLRPELILGVLQGALSDIADASEATVDLHPDDLALLEASPATFEMKLTFKPDPALTPGGCRVHSSAGDVDATRETRMAQMQARIEELTREQS